MSEVNRAVEVTLIGWTNADGRYLGGIIEFHGNALVILGNNAFAWWA